MFLTDRSFLLLPRETVTTPLVRYYDDPVKYGFVEGGRRWVNENVNENSCRTNYKRRAAANRLGVFGKKKTETTVSNSADNVRPRETRGLRTYLVTVLETRLKFDVHLMIVYVVFVCKRQANSDLRVLGCLKANETPPNARNAFTRANTTKIRGNENGSVRLNDFQCSRSLVSRRWRGAFAFNRVVYLIEYGFPFNKRT